MALHKRKFVLDIVQRTMLDLSGSPPPPRTAPQAQSKPGPSPKIAQSLAAAEAAVLGNRNVAYKSVVLPNAIDAFVARAELERVAELSRLDQSAWATRGGGTGMSASAKKGGTLRKWCRDFATMLRKHRRHVKPSAKAAKDSTLGNVIGYLQAGSAYPAALAGATLRRCVSTLPKAVLKALGSVASVHFYRFTNRHKRESLALELLQSGE